MVVVLVVMVVVLVVLVVVLSAVLLPRMASGERSEAPPQRAALQLICLCPLHYLLLVCR